MKVTVALLASASVVVAVSPYVALWVWGRGNELAEQGGLASRRQER